MHRERERETQVGYCVGGDERAHVPVNRCWKTVWPVSPDLNAGLNSGLAIPTHPVFSPLGEGCFPVNWKVAWDEMGGVGFCRRKETEGKKKLNLKQSNCLQASNQILELLLWERESSLTLLVFQVDLSFT